MFTFVQTKKQITGLVWFNVQAPQGYSSIDYRYNSSPSVEQAFREGMTRRNKIK